MHTKLIRIDEEVSALIESCKTPELNTPNKVLRDLFGLPRTPGLPQTEHAFDKCEACDRAAEVVLEAHRISTNQIVKVMVCKDHMLDPGPLLDW